MATRAPLLRGSNVAPSFLGAFVQQRQIVAPSSRGVAPQRRCRAAAAAAAAAGGQQSLEAAPPGGRERSLSPSPVPARQLPYSVTDSSDGEFSECAASYVFVSNEEHPTWTRLNIDVPDSPGLLRTITWVLNGMGMRVQNASLTTTEDGTAQDVFWLTTYSGKKLTDQQATLLADRVEDFVVACVPKPGVQTEWACKNLRVSNTAHPKWTLLEVEGEPQRQGFLLELASVISGTGVQVKEASIQSGPTTPAAEKPAGAESWPVDVAPPGFSFSHGRYFKFLLSTAQGNKLDTARVGALLFTYDVFTDARHMPLVAPNMDAYARRSQ